MQRCNICIKSIEFFYVTLYCSLFNFFSIWDNFQVSCQWLRIWEYILISQAHTIYSYLRCALSFCLHRNHYCFKGWSLHKAAKHVTETAGPTLKLLSPSVIARVLAFTLKSNLRCCSAAQSLQSCPTLWDPIDRRLAGSSVPGILQSRILE